jgi:hypothetical protein
MRSRFPKILYFLNQSIATPKEKLEAMQYGPNCFFRNAAMVNDEGSLESCSGVAGAVPKRYADVYPEAHEALIKWQRSVEQSAMSAINANEDSNKGESKQQNIWKPNA